MTKLRAVAIALATVLNATTARALDVQRADTRYHDGRYELELEATVHAPPDEVERVLRNYADYPKLDSRVLEAKVLERTSPNELLLYSRVRACFAFICRGVERVERVEERHYDLVAHAVPERSDVRFGLTHTQISTLGPSATRVVYRTQIEPKFWVPRFVGRRAMLGTLRDATIQLFTQVERFARGEDLGRGAEG
jgi:hypothetical protein